MTAERKPDDRVEGVREGLALVIETAMTDDGHRSPRNDETRYLAHTAADATLAWFAARAAAEGPDVEAVAGVLRAHTFGYWTDDKGWEWAGCAGCKWGRYERLTRSFGAHVHVTHVAEQIAALRPAAPGVVETAEPIKVEWGVVLDDNGTTETYDVLDQAEAMAVYADGVCPIVRIETWPHSPGADGGA